MSVKKGQAAKTEERRFSVQTTRVATNQLENKTEPSGKVPALQAKVHQHMKVPEILKTKISSNNLKITKSNGKNRETDESGTNKETVIRDDLTRVKGSRRASDPGTLHTRERRGTQMEQKARRDSDLGPMLNSKKRNQFDHERQLQVGLDSWSTEQQTKEQTLKYTDVHCLPCQRKGRKILGHFYCHDCKIGLCENCAKEHFNGVAMNRHSVSAISKTFTMSPNQGPFPNLTQIGTIKMDREISIKGSAFLPNGEFLVADCSNSKILMFTGDYTRKHIGSLTLQKENKWDENKPNPLDVTEISSGMFAFTTTTGCIYIVSIGVSMLMKIERIITVIRFESNYGECLGLAYNSAEQSLYVGCTSDREGTYFNIYGLDGVQRRTIRNSITDVPEYLVFGPDTRKLYSADSDSVTVYDVRDFSIIEQYTELQAQTRDIFVDKYGYLYTLALERRTFKTPGSIYRLELEKGVTKVTALDDKPSSISYCPKTDTVAVTFTSSRIILLFKLVLRSFEKHYGNELKRY